MILLMRYINKYDGSRKEFSFDPDSITSDAPTFIADGGITIKVDDTIIKDTTPSLANLSRAELIDVLNQTQQRLMECETTLREFQLSHNFLVEDLLAVVPDHPMFANAPVESIADAEKNRSLRKDQTRKVIKVTNPNIITHFNGVSLAGDGKNVQIIGQGSVTKTVTVDVLEAALIEVLITEYTKGS